MKYDQLKPPGQRLARIPRFGRLIAMMGDAQLGRLTSEAATFWELYHYVDIEHRETTGLLDSGLRDSLLGWRDIPDRPEPKPDRREFLVRQWQCDLAMAFLGAIAFDMTCGQDGKGTSPPIYVVEGDLRKFMQRVFDRLWNSGAYVDVCGDRIEPKSNLMHDWKRIKQLNSEGMRYLVLSNLGAGEPHITQPGERILFADISTQAFFAAYWAAKWSSDQEREMMLAWFPEPIGETNSPYNEFWRMVVDLPNEAIDLDRFQKLFTPLYDGTLVDDRRLPIRSTELIYRSWGRMVGTQMQRTFQSEFRRILAGEFGEEKRQIASGILCEEGLEGESSKFVSLGAGERGPLDTGEFTMGAPSDECPESDIVKGGQDNPCHSVRLSPYRLHRYCVSNEEYELFDPRHKELREFGEVENIERHPVVNVSWYDAWSYSRWLGGQTINGVEYELGLPTEAQWEYACRCGENTSFTWPDGQNGERIESGNCNFNGNYPWGIGARKSKSPTYLERTIPVDGKDGELQVLENPWGFSQMHGNVWEWCQDWYAVDYYYTAPVIDPEGPSEAVVRVLRGGSWIFGGGDCRSAGRYRLDPGFRAWNFGFRLAAVPLVSHVSERKRRPA